MAVVDATEEPTFHLDEGAHVYILARTATATGLDRAHQLQDQSGIGAAVANDHDGLDDEDRRVAVGRETGDMRGGGRLQPGVRHTGVHRTGPARLAVRLGRGGLSPEQAQYFHAFATAVA